MIEFNKSEFEEWGRGSLTTLDALGVRTSCEEAFLELSEREREQVVMRAIDQHGASAGAYEVFDEPFDNFTSDQKDTFAFDTTEGMWQGQTADQDNDGEVEKVVIVAFNPH